MPPFTLHSRYDLLPTQTLSAPTLQRAPRRIEESGKSAPETGVAFLKNDTLSHNVTFPGAFQALGRSEVKRIMKLGTIRTVRGNLFVVRWDAFSKEVYVSYAGGTFVGKAYSPAEAMRKAEAWLYNK